MISSFTLHRRDRAQTIRRGLVVLAAGKFEDMELFVPSLRIRAPGHPQQAGSRRLRRSLPQLRVWDLRFIFRLNGRGRSPERAQHPAERRRWVDSAAQLSVITPVFPTTSPYLQAAFDSLLHESLPAWRWEIQVDGESVDTLPELATIGCILQPSAGAHGYSSS